MLGQGPDEAAWRALAANSGSTAAVTWLSWVPHARMAELYHGHDALLFPSLHN